MKKITLTTTFLLLAGLAAFQLYQNVNVSKASTAACCHLEANTAFNEFAKEQAFVMAHELPRTLEAEAKLGEMIEYEVENGENANAYFIPAKKSTNKCLLVIHEWWGLNEHIKAEAEKYYQKLGKKVHVIALDLYDGKVASAREDAAKYMQATKAERAQAIIEGAMQLVEKKSGKSPKIASVGWCFGGGWSLQTALIAQERAAACVIYYGMPEKDVAKLKTLKTDVLGVFANEDKWINPEVVQEFKANLDKAGVAHQIEQYDADHAFANPTSPRYVESAAQEAFAKTIKYLKKRLR